MVQTTKDNIPQGFQRTEVGVIPEDWEIVKLRNTVDFLDGRRKPIKSSDRAKMQGNYPYYGASGIIDYVNDYIFDDELILLGEDGENILSRNLPLAFIIKGKVWVNNHAHVLKVKEGFNPYYIVNKLESINFEDYNSGTAQPKLNKKTCEGLKLSLPPTLAEQTAIANALSDMDALINAQEKLIHKKRLIKQGAMQELLRPKEGWVETTIGDCAHIIGGGTPSSFNPNFWNGNINWFTPTEIGTEKYVNSSNRKITAEGLKNSSAKILPVGTILLTTRAGIGDLSILKCEASTNQGFQSLLAKNNTDNEFLYYLTATLKNKLIQNASGSTFLEISPGKIRSLKINVPPKNTQTNIAQILSDMDTEIEQLETQLTKYKQMKAGMMQELLTGKKRLNLDLKD